jgi:hypothetical protein
MVQAYWQLPNPGAAMILIVCTFVIGYILGRWRKFYVFRDGVRIPESLETFQFYVPKTKGVFVDLFGLDYNEGVVRPIYRPAIRFLSQPGMKIVGFRISDFREGAVWVQSTFPFVWAGYRNLREEKLYD